MLHCHAWSPYWFRFLLQVIECAVFSFAHSGNLCTTFDQAFRAKNNSHVHRAGKCAKHFLLLETSAGQNLSRSFSPRLFYSPSPPFPTEDHLSLSSSPCDSTDFSTISIFFCCGCFTGPFNSPAHDQMLN